MNRTALIANLERVAPALADNAAMVPVLSHFWFTGRELVAFNGIISIATPCETDFAGAVPRTLLHMLKTSAAKEVTMTTKGDNLEVKAAAARFKLAALPVDDFAETLDLLPGLPKEAFDVDAPEFMTALASCMRSVSADTSHAEYQGVTVTASKADLWLFGYDRVTISHGVAKGKMYAESAILPADFCRQAINLAADATDFKLDIGDDWAVLVHDDTTISARLIRPDQPSELKNILAKALAQVKREIAIDDGLRGKLTAMLERAKIIAHGGIAKTRTKIDIEGGNLFLFSESDIGEVEDAVGGLDGHPDVAGTINPAAWLEGIEFDTFAFTTDVLVMTKEDGRLVYLVSGRD